MKGYSAAALIRHGLRGTPWPKAFRRHDLRPSYDVVIIGGGVHGLAAAYYLARNHGITDVAVLDKGYLGGGGSGRNTAIIRSNYLTPDGVRFYHRSVELYQHLAAELDFNVMFSRRGHLTLAHNDGSLRTMRWRAEVNKACGVDSEVVGPDEVSRLVPPLDASAEARYPVLGALYHPPGGIVRHDAVVWGYARAADAAGSPAAPGHRGDRDRRAGRQGPWRADLARRDRRPGGAELHRRLVDAGVGPGRGADPGPDVPAAGGGDRAGQAVPGHGRGLRHAARLRQPDRPGRAGVRRCVDPFASYSTRGSLEFAEGLATHVLQLMPACTGCGCCGSGPGCAT